MDYCDKKDGVWAQKRKKQKMNDNNSNNKTAKLLYRTARGVEYEVATGALTFQIPVRPVKPTSKPASPVRNRKRRFDFIDDEASEASSEEISDEIEIPEDLSASQDPNEFPSLEYLSGESSQ